MKLEIKREIYINASPETVYSYLTVQEKVAEWFGVINEIDSRAGGIFKVGASDEFMVIGEFVEAIPHEKVVFFRFPTENEPGTFFAG